MGTAADRAAAPCQRLVLILFISGGPKVSKGRSESPLVVPNGHETVTCGGIAATPCLFPQKEGDHPQQRMVKDTLSLRKGILSAAFPAKPPLKGEVPALGGRRGSSPNAARPRRLCQPPWTQPSRRKPHPTLRRNHLCRSPQAKRQPLFGREESGGRGASLREAASPPSVPHPTLSLGEGARGRGLLFREAPSLAIFTLSQSLSFAMMMRRRRERMLVMAAAT